LNCIGHRGVWKCVSRTNGDTDGTVEPYRFTLLAPDLLRTDSPENIYLQADGLSNPVTVAISIRPFSSNIPLLLESVTLSQENGFHTLKTIQLPSDDLNREEKKNKFVYLKVDFEGHYSEERVLMVSFHSGYIFIQTDKPIYNPGDTVRVRAFVSDPSFKAFDSTITVDIKNPDDVVVKQTSRMRAVNGIFSDTFPLSDIVNEGTWTVIAKFDHWQQNTFTSHFEVKKYVLPAFNVTLTPRQSFLNLEDNQLEVEVSARYLFGEPVQGKAYVVFGVKINKDMRRLPTVKQVSDLDGGVVTLSMEEIKAAYPNIRQLVGHSLYVKASVLTTSGSDLVEAEKTGIKVVESPYVVSFRDMPEYFKPGLPFDFTIQVSHHDGSPARNVPIKLTVQATVLPLVVTSGTTRASINMPNIQRPQVIKVSMIKASTAGLRQDQQAQKQISVVPYMTFNRQQQNYLYISTGVNRVSVGDQLSVTLTINTADQSHRDFIQHITYMVLSKGKMVSAERVDVTGQVFTRVTLMVTPQMMPSFRFVAFYTIPWTRGEEVVADSIWVDVSDTCVGGLSVGPVDGIGRDYSPGRSFGFKLRGDPGSKVSLVAVDNAVYLLKNDRLTQKKIWDVVEHRDFGCTRGGGRDARRVFTDAGLLYDSSSGFKTPSRQVLQCPGSTRRRRSVDLLQRKAQLESLYTEKLQRRCCKDGLREIPMPYSCTRRSLYITEGWECIRAFRYCCATYRDQVFDTEIPTTPPPTTPAPTTPAPTTSAPTTTSRRLPLKEESYRMYNKPVERVEIHSFKEEEVEEEEEEEEEEEWEDMDETQVYLLLSSSHLFHGLFSLLASKTVDHPLPDSITEWGILAVSSSPHTGFCVADPYNVKAVKKFFVDLKLPYSVARNEQVEIKAVVHNYLDMDLHVRVVLMKTNDMCSIAFKDRHTQEISVPARSSVAVPYTIVPQVVGKLPIEVMVVNRDMTGQDRIQKLLRVVLEGVQKTEVWSTVLNPTAEGGTQNVHMGKIELRSVVPNSVPETFLNIRGNVLADSIDNSISEDSLASLIRMPGGCVEQNLASITLPLIATLYLDRTNDWESVGVQRKAEALRYIRRGYEKQLVYRKSDGSYPPYSKEGASTWITAYVVKVFSMAHSIIGINEQQVCEPLLYLLKNKHRASEGNFVEDNPVYDTTMTGGLRGDDPKTTLTAFVFIALAEAKQAGIQCNSPDVNVESAMRKTADYLKRALQIPRRPYTVAIASYALALMRTTYPFDSTPALMKAAAPDGSHWADSDNTLYSLEATGYALLALVKQGRMDEASAPFLWLNGQRRRGGGFGSTQPTMVVLHALSEYMIHRPPPVDLTLDVDVNIVGRSGLRYHFNPSTAYAARSTRLPALNADLAVQARGNGQGILEVVTHYNQLPEVDEQMPCNNFELNVSIAESSEKPPADVEKSYEFTIKVRALGSRDVRMVVLDISLPTGFTPENADLERVISLQIKRRGTLFKLSVSHKEPEILIFRLQQSFRVGLLQPSPVTVYEYYNPDHRCSRTYTPTEDKEELTQICRENVCRCTQGDCCIAKTDSENFPNKERETFACMSLHHVFQVKVLNVSRSYYDKYEMEITQVIKLGEEAGVETGQTRFFMSHGGCRDGLNLQEGSLYLIIGPQRDKWDIDSTTNRYTYMLGKDTWVERWPSPADCESNPNLMIKCTNLDEAAYELSVNACRL
uniref:Complement component c3b, tandem duplicate 2 n=1 Tax=Sphaeramia orbicularis TaxID=375764 RepID=A0A672YZ56_9TELE